MLIYGHRKYVLNIQPIQDVIEKTINKERKGTGSIISSLEFD